jgi:plasmid stabilization system protein ParE
MRVVLSRKANLDLLDQTEWLSEQSPAAARDLRARIEDALRLLAQFPHSGIDVGEGEREWIIRIGQSGLVAVYRIEADRVIIGRLFHTSQDRTALR